LETWASVPCFSLLTFMVVTLYFALIIPLWHGWKRLRNRREW
jgi:hypothetical protein